MAGSKEIQSLIRQLNIIYDGDPWFGRSIKAILSEVDLQWAFKKPNNQHSAAELLYHMINWREFTISRFPKQDEKKLDHFDTNDWKKVDGRDTSLWQKGVTILENTQNSLLNILDTINDDFLKRKVDERDYDFRFLLNGLIQHDIYHLGQIAYVKKLLS